MSHTIKFELSGFLAAVLLVVTVYLSPYCQGEDSLDNFIDDSRDSEALVTTSGQWVPVPLPISNPTIGFGVMPVLIYLHPKKEDTPHNTTTGIGGLYTDTRSWFTGVFHDDYWLQDKVRFSGFAGTGKFNLDFFGIGDVTLPGGRSIPYEFDIFATLLKLQARIPGTEHLFAGALYSYINSDSFVETSKIIPGLPDLNENIKTAGLGLLVTYDSRNNNYYPTQGQWFEAKWQNFGETWGGDNKYDKTTAFYNYYYLMNPKTVLALRTRLDTSNGDVPYFDLPYLAMDGFSRDRYRDQNSLSMHAEGRYKFNPRWGMIVFYEFGWLNSDLNNIFSTKRIDSAGFGVRWQVTQAQQLHLGVDAAFSSDDRGIYIRIGERF